MLCMCHSLPPKVETVYLEEGDKTYKIVSHTCAKTGRYCDVFEPQ